MRRNKAKKKDKKCLNINKLLEVLNGIKCYIIFSTI
jgi:hypothetical protein